jgi:hypothetical protein
MTPSDLAEVLGYGGLTIEDLNSAESGLLLATAHNQPERDLQERILLNVLAERVVA